MSSESTECQSTTGRNVSATNAKGIKSLENTDEKKKKSSSHVRYTMNSYRPISY